MSWEIVEASARECLEAYLSAIHRGDHAQAEYWRGVVMERLVVLGDAARNHRGSGGTDRAQ